MSEKMRVLDLLEAGKITADEASKLLEALGKSRMFDKEKREQMEEKLQKFAHDVNKFAKDVGEKVHGMYKNMEPKIKKASQTALEKAASALDDLACTIQESMGKGECNGEETNCCNEAPEAPEAPLENTQPPHQN
ncbi:MAG: hypothetical protein FWC71_11355 [Defluviitaleaceae bacterium]|nr:hypothetical protein [Defluviitaleaceae bacterium]